MLEVRPCDNNDFADLTRIQLAAFNTGITRLSVWIETYKTIHELTLYPVKPNATEETKATQIEKHLKSATEEPDVFYLKVVDTDLGDKMIGAAKWRINHHERTEEQIQSMLPVPKETDTPAARDFFTYLAGARKEYMNTKPFACK